MYTTSKFTVYYSMSILLLYYFRLRWKQRCFPVLFLCTDPEFADTRGWHVENAINVAASQSLEVILIGQLVLMYYNLIKNTLGINGARIVNRNAFHRA